MNNITLLLSLDNRVYGVMNNALELHPFNILGKMTVGNTYLYGIKTNKIFATSVDIEDIISLTSNGASFKPLFIKDNTKTNVITTKNDNSEPISVYIDYFRIANETDNILRSSYYDELRMFCCDILDDYVVGHTNNMFESLTDHDMMIQCSKMLNDHGVETDNMSFD
jgi:hypothetical protein